MKTSRNSRKLAEITDVSGSLKAKPETGFSRKVNHWDGEQGFLSVRRAAKPEGILPTGVIIKS